MVDAASANGDTLLYLYGFIANPIDRSAAAAIRADRQLTLVRWKEIACAATRVPAEEYRQPPQSATEAEQLAWLTPRAWRHHQVLERLQRVAGVVPLKFGTLCDTAADVKALLRQLRDPIRDLLTQIDGRDEWSLRATLDEGALHAMVEAEDAALQQLRSSTLQLSEGQAFFARRKLAAAVAARVDDWIASLARQLDRRLGAIGCELRDGESVPPDRLRAGDALHRAVLIGRDSFTAIEQALADLEFEHVRAGLSFELSGPWPAYSFATGLMGDDDGATFNGCHLSN